MPKAPCTQCERRTPSHMSLPCIIMSKVQQLILNIWRSENLEIWRSGDRSVLLRVVQALIAPTPHRRRRPAAPAAGASRAAPAAVPAGAAAPPYAAH